jgi:hypothetical protein
MLFVLTLVFTVFGEHIGSGGYGGKGWRDNFGSHDGDTRHANGITPIDFIRHCRVDEAFKARQGNFWKMSQHNWSTALTIYLVQGRNDHYMRPVVTIPYTMLMNYDEANCRYVFTLAWYASCDNITNLCPLLDNGLYLSVQQTNVNIKIPQGPPSVEQEPQFYQSYPTPSAAGNPDQNPWLEKHWVTGNQSVGIYKLPNTHETVYEELISWEQDEGPNNTASRQYSNQQFAPSANRPGKRQMIWVYGESYGIKGNNIPTADNIAFNKFFDGTLPLVEYAPGKSSYMMMVSPYSSKRSASTGATLSQAEYDDRKTNIAMMHQLGIGKAGMA